MQAQGARVVTPEAVVLDVQTAGLGSRAFARAIDVLIQGATLIAVFLVTGIVAASSDSGLGTAGVVVDLILITVVIFGYPIIWESLWRGRTPGKAALGLRVVTRQGAPIRFRHALVRGLVGLGEVTALPLIGVISLLVSNNDQRLGDIAAGTIVIRERAAVSMSAPVVFYPPPGCESFVDSLDVSAMTSAEYETVRSFLIRAHEMDQFPRSNLAARLAGPLVERWHQPVPTGAGPEMWLACVACAYQRRHGAPMASGPAPQQYGPPPYGPQQYGPPQYGPPQYGPPQYGPPPYGPPPYGPPPYGPPQYGPDPRQPYGQGPSGAANPPIPQPVSGPAVAGPPDPPPANSPTLARAEPPEGWDSEHVALFPPERVSPKPDRGGFAPPD